MSSSTVSTGEIARNISNAAVGLIADYTGRGPTKARTTISGDWVFITLEDTLTKGERQLATNGHADAVLATRHSYQQIMRTELERVVEQHSGRRVVAFMSDNHIEPDVGIEVFMLEPDGHEVVAAGTLSE
jgi:uncharacterized protein YbcI